MKRILQNLILSSCLALTVGCVKVNEPHSVCLTPREITEMGMLMEDLHNYLTSTHAEEFMKLSELMLPDRWLVEVIMQARKWDWLESERLHLLLTQSLLHPEISVSEFAERWKPLPNETPETHFQRMKNSLGNDWHDEHWYYATNLKTVGAPPASGLRRFCLAPEEVISMEIRMTSLRKYLVDNYFEQFDKLSEGVDHELWVADIITEAKEWDWLDEPVRLHFLLTQSAQHPEIPVRKLAERWKPLFNETPEGHFQRILSSVVKQQARSAQ